MFVTVEGIEGCGKSTLLSGLSQRLRESGREILVTREPGGSIVGDEIRALFLDPRFTLTPLTEALLVNASRAQHVTETIFPALRRGTIVLCDRFVDSTLAYQGFGRGIDIALLRTICDAATGALTPDVTFVLDVPVAVSRERVASRRTRDRVDMETDAFHERVRAGFLALARESPRYRVFDGTRATSELAREAESMLRRGVA